ncbi:MAG: hypothetical protein LR015_13335, partial [Verrucomicrobia bacterium]|nr:hypothetical protein [Verrucomicrobiota bacterium]
MIKEPTTISCLQPFTPAQGRIPEHPRMPCWNHALRMHAKEHFHEGRRLAWICQGRRRGTAPALANGENL